MHEPIASRDVHIVSKLNPDGVSIVSVRPKFSGYGEATNI
jgi:hypothetical protein